MEFWKHSAWARPIAAMAILALPALSPAARAGELWEPIMSSGGSYVPSGYSVVFNDEFSGTQLNREKWATRYIYANGTLDQLTSEAQVYRDNANHLMYDGMLSLTARRVGQGYESGMIRSRWEFKPSQNTSYYVEARVRMPAGKGVFPAFWLNSGYSPAGKLYWGPEIDIFEFVVDGIEENPSSRPKNMVHSAAVSHGGRIPSKITYAHPNYQREWNLFWAKSDLTADFHTYGLLWTATDISFYVDGVRTNARTYSWIYDNDGKPAGPAHILLNLAIGGDWAGRHGIDDSAFPQALDVDWVRVYGKTATP
jgi:beta-glucanase (GH16 family)